MIDEKTREAIKLMKETYAYPNAKGITAVNIPRIIVNTVANTNLNINKHSEYEISYNMSNGKFILTTRENPFTVLEKEDKYEVEPPLELKKIIWQKQIETQKDYLTENLKNSNIIKTKNGYEITNIQGTVFNAIFNTDISSKENLYESNNALKTDSKMLALNMYFENNVQQSKILTNNLLKDVLEDENIKIKDLDKNLLTTQNENILEKFKNNIKNNENVELSNKQLEILLINAEKNKSCYYFENNIVYENTINGNWNVLNPKEFLQQGYNNFIEDLPIKNYELPTLKEIREKANELKLINPPKKNKSLDEKIEQKENIYKIEEELSNKKFNELEQNEQYLIVQTIKHNPYLINEDRNLTDDEILSNIIKNPEFLNLSNEKFVDIISKKRGIQEYSDKEKVIYKPFLEENTKNFIEKKEQIEIQNFLKEHPKFKEQIEKQNKMYEEKIDKKDKQIEKLKKTNKQLVKDFNRTQDLNETYHIMFKSLANSSENDKDRKILFTFDRLLSHLKPEQRENLFNEFSQKAQTLQQQNIKEKIDENINVNTNTNSKHR